MKLEQSSLLSCLYSCLVHSHSRLCADETYVYVFPASGYLSTIVLLLVDMRVHVSILYYTARSNYVLILLSQCKAKEIKSTIYANYYVYVGGVKTKNPHLIFYFYSSSEMLFLELSTHCTTAK